ncbi:unnamed protein product [Menidia menidia]|uniref:(Atlantic silverside) hypothetical protein n=1 Tax=Menidia menidia TaxID=238744 RepID=A0A8S4AKT9_9TELE|nr:unnamed protein product [Menidia menidia]
MKPYMFLLLLGIHKVVTVYHSLKYFYTASSGVSHFPEFVAVVLVDDIEILRYDSKITKATPKQDWVIRVEQDHPLFLQNSTESFRVAEEVYKKNIDIAKQRFNKTEGTHILQMMTGCEWDESDGITYGNLQFGYDGEDFIAFDLRTERWITSRPQAHSTRAKWDRDQEDRAYRKKYLTQTCVEWLRTYLMYGKSVLMRTGTGTLWTLS